MLPLPNLDDRTFDELVREARDLIPILYPDWSDENAHDPGITLLEMLAWHLEVQQYQLNRLTESHERKFLKLLGEAPRPRTPATTSVSFSNAARPMLIPYGTLLRVGDLPFETVRPVTVLPDMRQRVIIQTADGTQIIDGDLGSGNTPFYPFGERAEAGSGMILELDAPLPKGMPLSLWFQLIDQEPDIRIPARYKGFTPSGTIVWSCWEERDGEGGAWRPLPMERDETYGLTQSGPILFELPHDFGDVTRLMARLERGGYNDAPHIRRVVWNEVFAKQGQTLCTSECFDGREEEMRGGARTRDSAAAGASAHAAGSAQTAGSAQAAGDAETPGDAEVSTAADEERPPTFELAHALFQHGRVYVQFRLKHGGWIDVEEEKFDVLRADGRAFVRFRSWDDLPYGKQSIRVIAVNPEFVDLQWLGRGTGMSGQRFPIPVRSALPDELRLQVGWLADDGRTMIWYDWRRVDDFDESDADSFHYVVDEEEEAIRFSDGICGAVPPAMPTDNIRIIGCRTGVGAAGNVKEDTIKEVELYEQSLQVTNLYPAYGGMEAETVKEALQRAALSVLEPQCGITGADLERRVREIPGLRIARVKAIPGYHPGIREYPEERDFGHISIVVVPRSRNPLPKPSEGMIETIRRHLEPYRLLTVKLHVIPPEYVRISVRAVVVVDPRYEGREWTVRQALEEWLQAFDGETGAGWEFGRTVYKSDVYDIIHRVPGVRYIQDVWITGVGRGAVQEEGGDIRIPPNGLAISGEHEIEFLTG